MLAVLEALGAHQLHPQAHAERRHPALEHELVEDGHEPERVQALHRHAEGANAGQDDALGRAQHVGVACDDGLGAQRVQRALHRAHVAHAVVDDRDHRYGAASLSPSATAPSPSGQTFLTTSPSSSRTKRPLSSVTKIALLVNASSVS